MGRPRAPHGTEGAYRRHKTKHERICDACQAWKDGSLTDKVVVVDKVNKDVATVKRIRQVDFVDETLANLEYVEKALKALQNAGSHDKIGPLSKRKSELLRELKDFQAEADPTTPEVDPLERAMAGAGAMAGVTQLHPTTLPDAAQHA